MHSSSLDSLRTFFDAYLTPYVQQTLTLLNVGSAVVEAGHASDRGMMASPSWRYIGMDIEAGQNVDVVVKDPYQWAEIETASMDVVLCNQVLEHAEYFWLTVQEIARVLKPRGFAVLIAPSSGPVHRYPVDCWRFYPDAMPALARYAGLTLLENHRQTLPLQKKGNRWRDASAILQKPDGAGASVISLTSPLNALSAREQVLLSQQSAFALRLRAAKPHIRAISRIFRYPVHRLGDAESA